MTELIVSNADEMREFAGRFIAELQPQEKAATVLALSGALGAGKTTFAQAVAKALGVEETVNSPTFVIEKVYALSNQKWQRLVHIDAYRLKNADELRAIGWNEQVADPANLVLIEWPENVSDGIPEDARRIAIEIGEGEARMIHHDN